MAAAVVVSLIRRTSFSLKYRLDICLDAFFGRGFPPAPQVCIAGIDASRLQQPAKSVDLRDLWDGLLLAVPEKRRTIEKRWKRKFGHPDYIRKILIPKTTLRTCNQCGDDFEVGVLCPTCYKNVMQETQEIQDKIQEALKLNPVEKEVVILYDEEKANKNPEWNGKQLIEMNKPRPKLFSNNLLQKTTQEPSTDTSVATYK